MTNTTITRRTLASLTATSLLATGAILGGATSSASSAASERAAKVTKVNDASLAWGFDNESSNAAFAPGTANFFSAGKVPDTGGGRVITKNEWRATAPNVVVSKKNANGVYKRATWAGLKTQPNGQPLGSPTAGTFSYHRIELSNGTGTVDPATDKATLSWDTSFTVVYYSGYTYFYVSDPKLVVRADHTATLTGTLGGFGSSQADPNAWEPLPDTRVTLAKFVDVDVTAAGVRNLTPLYRKVKYTPPAGSDGVAQVRSGANWGSFPKSFVDYQQRTGQHSYWYSSGGSTDDFKVALPVTVKY